jgi:hypothetical protein
VTTRRGKNLGQLTVEIGDGRDLDLDWSRYGEVQTQGRRLLRRHLALLVFCLIVPSIFTALLSSWEDFFSLKAECIFFNGILCQKSRFGGVIADPAKRPGSTHKSLVLSTTLIILRGMQRNSSCNNS